MDRGQTANISPSLQAFVRLLSIQAQLNPGPIRRGILTSIRRITALLRSPYSPDGAGKEIPGDAGEPKSGEPSAFQANR
jgi:hypothetical protein